MQRAGHGIDATGEGEGERRNAFGAPQLQFVLAELVVVDQKIHARRIDHDVALFLPPFAAGRKRVSRVACLRVSGLPSCRTTTSAAAACGEAMTKFTADASYFNRKVCGPVSTASKYSAVEAQRPLA